MVHETLDFKHQLIYCPKKTTRFLRICKAQTNLPSEEVLAKFLI